MTDRLYYNDPYLREFDATVQSVAERAGRVAVTLDRTAFYPTSGGQPFDTGVLGSLRIVDVVDDDEGTIAHVVEPAADARVRAGDAVHGAIDWARRFDHMQQHTGQHVLSAAFDRLFGVRTVSFHMGALASTIDLAREMTAAEINAAEDLANQIVWEDRPVAIRYATAEEAAALPLRKEPVRGGTLRLVDIDRFDLSACGGTHVARTGAIGVTAVVSWERFKGGHRIEFLCGGRALQRFRSLRDSVAGGVRLLSVLPDEIPAAIEKLQADAKDQKRAFTALQTELARYRAGELAETASEIGPNVKLVAQTVAADANGLKSLAVAIAARPDHFVVLTSAAAPTLVVVARSVGLAVRADAVLKTLLSTFGGRGGGNADLAQGGGLIGDSVQILRAACDAVNSCVRS
jgi:alanyl-tRNA synthetase